MPLDDSTERYKLVSVSYKLGQHHSHWIFETNEESLPCTSVLLMPWSLVYSLPGKDNQYTLMLLIALNLINLLFSVIGYHTCYCPDPQNSNNHLEGPTQACCSQQSGTTYSAVLVRSDCWRQIEWLLTWLKWTVQWCAWFSTIYGLLPWSKCCGGLLCWILGSLTMARRHTQILTSRKSS